MFFPPSFFTTRNKKGSFNINWLLQPCVECERLAWQSLIVAVVSWFSGTWSHLGGLQWHGEEERIPHSLSLLVCWNTAMLQVRGENKEAVVRIETGHVLPDEARTGWGRGKIERSFGPTRHVSQPGGRMVTSIPSISSEGLRQLHSGRSCQYLAASAVCFNIHKCVRCMHSAAQRSCYCARRCQNTPVTAWQFLKSWRCSFLALTETFPLSGSAEKLWGVSSYAR